ncbi:hypothetical protein BX05_24275 [Escherichia coli O157:NM str. 08-4540]|nr:hypothetical protein BX05_24275 [Escherichia coli O157:NM str. 08-4540]
MDLRRQQFHPAFFFSYLPTKKCGFLFGPLLTGTFSLKDFIGNDVFTVAGEHPLRFRLLHVLRLLHTGIRRRCHIVIARLSLCFLIRMFFRGIFRHDVLCVTVNIHIPKPFQHFFQLFRGFFTRKFKIHK